MLLEQKTQELPGSEELSSELESMLEPTITYMQRLSVLREYSAPPQQEFTPEMSSISEQITQMRDQEYTIVASTFGAEPQAGSLYVNQGLYSHGISFGGEGIRPSTARIQTAEQMLASMVMMLNTQDGEDNYSPFSFSAFSRTMRGIPVVNRLTGTPEDGTAEMFFRAPRGNDRSDLYNFAVTIQNLAESTLGKKSGFTCTISEEGIKLTFPNQKLFQAETYKDSQPFQIGLGFSSKDGRYVRQYDLTTSILADADDNTVFALLQQAEYEMIPAIHREISLPEEKQDILSLSGGLKNEIRNILGRFIKHEENTLSTKRDNYLQIADMFGKMPVDIDNLIHQLQTHQEQGSVVSNLDVARLSDNSFGEVLQFLLTRSSYFATHQQSITIFREAQNQLEELYPVHVGYGVIHALKTADKQYKSMSGKKKVEYDETGTLVAKGEHPHYSTLIDLSYLGGPNNVSLEEAITANELPIHDVKTLLASQELSPEEQRQLSVLLAIHRAPVVAGFSTLFDILTFVHYGNAVDINTDQEEITFTATIQPSQRASYTALSIENTGQNAPANIIEAINNPDTVRVASSHNGSGEALLIIERLSRLLNHTRPKLGRHRRFYAGYRTNKKAGFRLRVGLQSV